MAVTFGVGHADDSLVHAAMRWDEGCLGQSVLVSCRVNLTDGDFLDSRFPFHRSLLVLGLDAVPLPFHELDRDRLFGDGLGVPIQHYRFKRLFLACNANITLGADTGVKLTLVHHQRRTAADQAAGYIRDVGVEGHCLADLALAQIDCPREFKMTECIGPKLGEHTEEILANFLGYGEETIAELKAEGVI